MKKLLCIALAFIGLQALAQDKKEGSSHCPMHKMETSQSENNNNNPHCEKHDMMMDLSPEESANIETKKMTLLLDLNESQQKDVYALKLEQAKKRKAHIEDMKAKIESDPSTKPSTEEKAKMMNTMLDHKIEMKAKMKSILTPEQYAKWEKAQPKKSRKKGKKMGCCKMDK